MAKEKALKFQRLERKNNFRNSRIFKYSLHYLNLSALETKNAIIKI